MPAGVGRWRGGERRDGVGKNERGGDCERRVATGSTGGGEQGGEQACGWPGWALKPERGGRSGRSGKRRAWDSNPQPLTGHHISSVAANHSLTLQTRTKEAFYGEKPCLDNNRNSCFPQPPSFRENSIPKPILRSTLPVFGRNRGQSRPANPPWLPRYDSQQWEKCCGRRL